MRSRLGLGLVVAMAATGIGPLALPSNAATCPGVTSSGRWSSIELPALSALMPGTGTPADSISSYAVAAGRPKLLYAAGGRQVFRSRDGGCSWQVAVSLDTAGSATAASRLDPAYIFTKVVVPNSLPGDTSSTVYALATDWTSPLTVSPPVVLAVSRDDGATWRLSEPSAVALVPDYPRCSSGSLIAGADPQAVYLACTGSGAVEAFAGFGLARCWTSFYVSRDDGGSWTPIEPGVAAPCPAERRSRFGAEPATVADPRSPGWLWSSRSESAGSSRVQRLMLSTDDGRSVKDLAAGLVGTVGWVAVSARLNQGPRQLVLYGPGVAYLSTDGGVTATKLPPIPGPVDSRGGDVAAFFDPTGSALYALTAPPAGSTNPGPWLAPYRYDLGSGRWTVLPPWPAPKESPPTLRQFRSDNASPLGLYALAYATSTTPARLLVFR